MSLPFVVAITGASGVIYAIRLIEVLRAAGHAVHLTISPAGRTVLLQELGLAVDLERFSPDSLTLPAEQRRLWLADRLAADPLATVSGKGATEPRGHCFYHHHGDFMAAIASGSHLTAGMVICPCSGSTTSAVVTGASNNLIHRAADVHLKERRRLILVPRETPLSLVQLDNLRRGSELGATVLPAMPGWYHGVTELADLVDFIVARILDQLHVPHTLIQRWG